MIELLRIFAQYDPAFCRIKEDKSSGLLFAEMLQVRPFDDDRWLTVATVYSDGTSFIWIEWGMTIREATERAIVAQGWIFGLQHYSDFVAHVARPLGIHYWSNADNSAEALLGAYVKALEASGERSEG